MQDRNDVERQIDEHLGGDDPAFVARIYDDLRRRDLIVFNARRGLVLHAGVDVLAEAEALIQRDRCGQVDAAIDRAIEAGAQISEYANTIGRLEDCPASRHYRKPGAGMGGSRPLQDREAVAMLADLRVATDRAMARAKAAAGVH